VVMSEGRIEQIGTPDEIYDAPNSPFVFSFIGESSVLPVRIEHGKVLFEGKTLDLAPGDVPDGPAQLFLRPHDVDVVDNESGAISGEVKVLRRHAGLRRVDLDVGTERNRVEIELPADLDLNPARSIAFRPRRYRLYPSSQALDS
jgi:sulfate transport system ATP-binding protein